MREALVLALQDFTGAVVVVSHDRHLLRTVVDELYLVQDRAVVPFAGDLDDYQKLQQQPQRAKPRAGGDVKMGRPPQQPMVVDRQTRKREEAAHRERSAEQRKQVVTAERRLEAAQARFTAITASLADPELYQPAAAARLRQLLADEGALKAEIERLEHGWLAAQENLEAVDTAFRECQQ
jgi:ATP-binding cassette subfamily F protein 3